MTNNLRVVYHFIKSDYRRYDTKASLLNILLAIVVGRDHCLRYLLWFRLSAHKNVFQFLAIVMHKRYSVKYGIFIPRKTSIGYGLYIGHGLGIVINPTAVIGNNCNLSQFTTIGSNHSLAAIIGDNVYIGPSVCIVENVRIGDNVSIGAGAVVVKDIPANATAVGVPARVISYNDPGRYITSRWILTKE